MHLRRIGILVGYAAVLLGFGYAAHVAGVNGAVSRGAYVNSIFVREEAKCLQANDIECLRAHWRLRAEAAAESARRSVNGFGASSVESELREYIHWVEQLPPASMR
jgi:hypothetical protein